MWNFSGLFRCEKFQAYLGVKISGRKFSGVKFFNPPYLAQFQPKLHVKILAWSHVKISGLKQVWFTCENRCDRFGTGQKLVYVSLNRIKTGPRSRKCKCYSNRMTLTLSRALISAPALISNWRTSVWPLSEAECTDWRSSYIKNHEYYSLSKYENKVTKSSK